MAISNRWLSVALGIVRADVNIALLCFLVGDILVVDSADSIGMLGWTRSGDLIYATKGKIHAWPSSRVVDSGLLDEKLPPYPANTSGSWIREPGADRWARTEGIFDGALFQFTRLATPASTDTTVIQPFWRNGRIGHLVARYDQEPATFALILEGKSTYLTGKWNGYHGISPDGRFLTATKEPLLADNDLDILVWDGPGTQPKFLKQYRKACDDHAIPGAPLWNGKRRGFLINLSTAAYEYPFLATDRMVPLQGEAIWGYAKWHPDGSERYLIWLLAWTGDLVFDPSSEFPVRRSLVTTIELRDLKSGTTKRLARAVQRFETPGYDADEVELPGYGQIECAEIDLQSKRLALLVKKSGRMRLVVRPLFLAGSSSSPSSPASP